jgi:tetraacyldisaccharide 4'-kinase
VLRAGLRAVRVVELSTGAERPLAAFSGQRVHAVAAIGNPERFFESLRAAGLDVVPHAHADHAQLTVADVQFEDGAPVFMTEKDAVKCAHLDHANLWYLMSELEFSPGDDERLLRKVIRQLAQRLPAA